MNSLPKYWAVINDGSVLFKDTVVAYMNKATAWISVKGSFSGKMYYGYYGYFPTGYYDYKPDIQDYPEIQVLTIKQFIDMAKETFAPKEGDRVYVSDDRKHWQQRTYVATTNNGHILCTCSDVSDKYYKSGNFLVVVWKYMRPIQKSPIFIVLDDVLDDFPNQRVKIDEEIRFGLNYEYRVSREKLQDILDEHEKYNK